MHRNPTADSNHWRQRTVLRFRRPVFCRSRSPVGLHGMLGLRCYLDGSAGLAVSEQHDELPGVVEQPLHSTIGVQFRFVSNAFRERGDPHALWRRFRANPCQLAFVEAFVQQPRQMRWPPRLNWIDDPLRRFSRWRARRP
jgi:hypothetical protein